MTTAETNEIIVTSQFQMDKVPEDYNGFIIINNTTGCVRVKKRYKHHVEVRGTYASLEGNAEAIVRYSSMVDVKDNAKAILFENSCADVTGKGTAFLYGTSYAMCQHESRVFMYQDSKAVAKDKATVYCFGEYSPQLFKHATSIDMRRVEP